MINPITLGIAMAIYFKIRDREEKRQAHLHCHQMVMQLSREQVEKILRATRSKEEVDAFMVKHFPKH